MRPIHPRKDYSYPVRGKKIPITEYLFALEITLTLDIRYSLLA